MPRETDAPVSDLTGCFAWQGDGYTYPTAANPPPPHLKDVRFGVARRSRARAVVPPQRELLAELAYQRSRSLREQCFIPALGQPAILVKDPCQTLETGGKRPVFSALVQLAELLPPIPI